MRKMMMRVVSVLLVLMLAVSAGCGKKKSDSSEGNWEDPSNPGTKAAESAQWEDPTGDWVDPSNPGTKAEESEQWEDPTGDWVDPSKPSDQEEEAVTVAPAELTANGYRHEIDGWVFYTQHDIIDYIGNARFDVAKMLEDIFGYPVVAISPEGNFCVKIDQRNNDVVLRLGKYDSDYHRKNGGWNGIEMWYYKYSLKIITPENNGEKYYETGNSGHYATYELAEISLYVCENIRQWNLDVDAWGFTNNAFSTNPQLYGRFRIWKNGKEPTAQ